MRLSLAVVSFLALVGSAAAALPPQYQRQAEFAAIMDDSAVREALGGRMIDGLQFMETDRYEVTADGCVLDVRIVGLPSDNVPGPRRFAVQLASDPC